MSPKRKGGINLQKTAAIVTIVVGIATLVLLVIPALMNLTIVQNEPSGDELEAGVVVYANGNFYLGNGQTQPYPGISFPDFDTATVSGTITFYVLIFSGEVTNVELTVDDDAGAPAHGARAFVASDHYVAGLPADYELSYDTTQLENGEYLFRVQADLGETTSVGDGTSPGAENAILSIFQLNWNANNSTGSGGSGTTTTTTTWDMSLEDLIPVLGMVMIAGIVVLVVIVLYSRR
jgi:hypothetical protein